MNGPCSFEGCRKSFYAKGMCQSHYNRQWRGEEDPNLKYVHMTEELKVYLINEMKRGRSLTALSEESGYKKASISRMFLREVGMNVTDWRAEREVFKQRRARNE